MNITNRIENIIIAVIAIAITVAFLEFTSIATLKSVNARLERRIEKQDAVIVELAKIEKYKIENRFEKMKPKNGQIILELDNKLQAMKLDSIEPIIPVSREKGFFERLFNSKN